MKIVNRETFLKMPSGTLFMKYEPCVFFDLCEKRATIHDIDFWYISITNNIDSANTGEFVDSLTRAENDGVSINLSFDMSRDGIFDDKQLFAVYEKADIIKLIKHLNQALMIGYSETFNEN